MGLDVLWRLTFEHPDIAMRGTREESYPTKGEGTTATKHLAVFWDKKGSLRYLMLHNSGQELST